MKYGVGDLVTTGIHLYLVEEIKNSRYYVKEVTRDFVTWWNVHEADKDRFLNKVN